MIDEAGESVEAITYNLRESMTLPHVPPAPGYTEIAAEGLRAFGLSTDPLHIAAAGE